jgi:cysteine desulfurase
MGVDADRAAGAVRLSVGMMTADEDVDRAAAGLIEAWQRLADC